MTATNSDFLSGSGDPYSSAAFSSRPYSLLFHDHLTKARNRYRHLSYLSLSSAWSFAMSWIKIHSAQNEQ